MREILFRGKRKVNGEWELGFLFISRKGEYKIKWYDPHYGLARTSEVYQETVGQFTGMSDKHDKKIFEGDIVRGNDGMIYTVVWGGTGFYLRYTPPKSNGFYYDLLPLSNYWHADGAIVEVIGNIHDNPELLEAHNNG